MKRESLIHSTGVYILRNHCCSSIESMFAVLQKPVVISCFLIQVFEEGGCFQEGRIWIQGSNGFPGCKLQPQWFLASSFAVGRRHFLLEKVSSSSDYYAAGTDVLNFTNCFSQKDIFWITPFLNWLFINFLTYFSNSWLLNFPIFPNLQTS